MLIETYNENVAICSSDDFFEVGASPVGSDNNHDTNINEYGEEQSLVLNANNEVNEYEQNQSHY